MFRNLKNVFFGPARGNNNPTLQSPGQDSSDTGADSTTSAAGDCGQESNDLLPDQDDCDNDTDNTSPDTDAPDTGSKSTLQKMLSPPVCDIEPCAEHEDIQVFNTHVRFTPQAPIRQPPFLPQPSDPSKQPKRPFNHRRNAINRRLNFHGNNFNTGGGSQTGGGNGSDDNHGNDGDDEDDNDSDHSSPVTPGAEPPTNPSPTTEHTPNTRSGPITRSQTEQWVLLTTFLATTSTPTPSNKRKRASSIDLSSSTTTKGDRVSKRIRNSFSGSLPLPNAQELKRTRGQQKKFEAKLGKDHVFDPQHPGSVRREVVDAKSAAEGWRRESLHGEPWDGSKE